MISHEYRAIFVHIPKTAGTSVESALGHQRGRNDLSGTQDHRTLRELQWPLGGPAQLATRDNGKEAARAALARWRHNGDYDKNRQRPDRTQFRSYFKFSVVRNPWDRAFSWYQNVLWDDMHRARLGVRPDITFADFVRRCAGLDLLRPQTRWLVDFSGRIALDKVCRFENLSADFAQVAERIGLPTQPLPHLIRGSGQSYLDAYDDTSRRIIAERFGPEIDAFGYTFDGTTGPVGRTAGRTAPAGHARRAEAVRDRVTAVAAAVHLSHRPRFAGPRAV